MTEARKKLVLALIALLAIIGVWIAFANLPVITGCGYYGRCGPTATD